MKHIGVKKLCRSFSLPATLGFLLLASALVLGCVLIVGRMLSRPQTAAPDAAFGAQPQVQPTAELSSEAAAILVPEDGRLPSSSPSSAPSPAGPDTPAPTAAPTPSPTPMSAVSIPAFSEERMDFILLGFDEAHQADALCIVSLNGDRCTILSLPRNTLTADGATLQEASTPAQAFTGIRSVFPVYLRRYIELDMTGLADCIDAFGGVRLEDALKNGDEVAAYLEAGGSDELLRITRQQTLLHALIVQLRELGLLRLLSVKHTLQKHTDGNLSASQYIDVYHALRRLDADEIRFLTLPVDSVIRGGERLYEADRPLCEALARELAQ